MGSIWSPSWFKLRSAQSRAARSPRSATVARWLPLHSASVRHPMEASRKKGILSPFPAVRAQSRQAVYSLCTALHGGQEAAMRVTAGPTPAQSQSAWPVTSRLTICQQALLPLRWVWPSLPWSCPSASSNVLLPVLEALYNALCDTSPSGVLVTQSRGLWIGP